MKNTFSRAYHGASSGRVPLFLSLRLRKNPLQVVAATALPIFAEYGPWIMRHPSSCLIGLYTVLPYDAECQSANSRDIQRPVVTVSPIHEFDKSVYTSKLDEDAFEAMEKIWNNNFKNSNGSE